MKHKQRIQELWKKDSTKVLVIGVGRDSKRVMTINGFTKTITPILDELEQVKADKERWLRDCVVHEDRRLELENKIAELKANAEKDAVAFAEWAMLHGYEYYAQGELQDDGHTFIVPTTELFNEYKKQKG